MFQGASATSSEVSWPVWRGRVRLRGDRRRAPAWAGGCWRRRSPGPRWRSEPSTRSPCASSTGVLAAAMAPHVDRRGGGELSAPRGGDPAADHRRGPDCVHRAAVRAGADRMAGQGGAPQRRHLVACPHAAARSRLRAWAPLSLDPTATRIEVLKGVAYLLAFATALRLARTREGVAFLSNLVVATGMVLAAAAFRCIRHSGRTSSIWRLDSIRRGAGVSTRKAHGAISQSEQPGGVSERRLLPRSRGDPGARSAVATVPCSQPPRSFLASTQIWVASRRRGGDARAGRGTGRLHLPSPLG